MDKVTVFAPCRVGFAGGGTDLAPYAHRYGGAVLSAALTLGVTVTARRRSDDAVSLILDDYGVRETYATPAALPATPGRPASLVAALIRTVFPAGGVEVRVRAGLPAGSGLGTSGAVGVATAFALTRLGGGDTTAEAIAEIASRIEIDVLGRPIGRQDQYAAAFGGINLFLFSAEGVTRRPVTLTPDNKRELADYFMLFFSGKRRDSAGVLSAQGRRIAASRHDTLAALHRMKELALAMEEALRERAWERFGELMRRAWEAKTQAAPESADGATLTLFREAVARGAWALKVTGAGAGGFYLCMAPPDRRADLASYFCSRRLTPYPFAWDDGGARVVDKD